MGTEDGCEEFGEVTSFAERRSFRHVSKGAKLGCTCKLSVTFGSHCCSNSPKFVHVLQVSLQELFGLCCFFSAEPPTKHVCYIDGYMLGYLNSDACRSENSCECPRRVKCNCDMKGTQRFRCRTVTPIRGSSETSTLL